MRKAADRKEILEKITDQFTNPVWGIIKDMDRLSRDEGAEIHECVEELLKEMDISKESIKEGLRGSKREKMEFLVKVFETIGFEMKTKICDECTCFRPVIEKRGDDELDKILKKFNLSTRWDRDGGFSSGDI
ncbi:MAG: hypothetical protein QW112_02365 [Candidatus Micrarchaeia archaeon]